jgi:uncharacterized protein YqhQ
MLLSAAAANLLTGLAPQRMRARARVAGQLLSLGVATETFGWMTRNPEHPVARALSRPGHELQHRFSTSEPSAAQIEVAEAALAACLALEQETPTLSPGTARTSARPRLEEPAGGS